MDNELLLFDRLQVIKDTITTYGEENFYLSFSGGKDSTILHYLLDKALPGNRIPRVFIDTGIEYQMIREFVLGLANKDERFVIVKPSQPIKKMLEKYGYPFKSKQHSHTLSIYQHGGMSRAVKVYLGEGETKTGHKGKMFLCPNNLRYQFTPEFKLKCSDLCCKKLKKEPAEKWCKENNRTITITGMRKEEGGTRQLLGCIITDKNGQLKKFHPLVKVNEEWERWFVNQIEIANGGAYTCRTLLSAIQL